MSSVRLLWIVEIFEIFEGGVAVGDFRRVAERVVVADFMVIEPLELGRQSLLEGAEVLTC